MQIFLMLMVEVKKELSSAVREFSNMYKVRKLKQTEFLQGGSSRKVNQC